MSQGSLFPEAMSIKTVVILRRKDFDSLFEGFTKMRAVSYVVSPDLLLEFLDKRGYSELEVLVGENLTEPYRQELAQKSIELVERLASQVQTGTLRIYVPERTVHTKLYILEGQGIFRVIQSSANFTETARRAGQQVNYAWYADLPSGHPWLEKVTVDYRKHLERSSLFMGDLMDLLGQSQETPKRDVIENWLKGIQSDDVDLETKKCLQEISFASVEPFQPGVEKVVVQKLPDAPAARKQLERTLAPLNPIVTGSDLRLNIPMYLRYVQEKNGVPILLIDREKGEVRLGVNGSVKILTQSLPDAASVNSALEHLEAYVQTVDLGQTADPLFAKTSMMEALLFVLSAPFAHEYMKMKRVKFGTIDPRGPLFLYIYGPSQNGKSTFLRFALKLIGAQAIEPLSGGDFTKRKILGASAFGTAFPLVFDDVVVSQRPGMFEEVLKSYWEIWWRDEYVSPQIILSSNVYTLKEWAKSRVKKLDFDVHFVSSAKGKEQLARLFREENPVFKWFSALYLSQMSEPGALTDDELQPARTVMRKLYDHARRPLPEYFPQESIEKLFDTGRRAWYDLLNRMAKARIEWDEDRAMVHFTDDMQHYEMKEYENYLPQVVKIRRRGKTLVIENPREFKAWLDGPTPPRISWWKRFLRW